MASRDAAPASDQLPDGSGFRIGIVVSEWNSSITFALLEGAKSVLKKAGVADLNVEIQHVPGAFELPWGAKSLMKTEKKDAIICLGCVIKGETRHDEYIAQAVASGIMQLGLVSGVPVIFGVLTTENEKQAKERAGGKHGNKGEEAAITALRMAAIHSPQGSLKRKIGF